MLDSLNFTDFTKQIKADKIGQSQLRRSAKEGNIDTGLTGVLADYRGKWQRHCQSTKSFSYYLRFRARLFNNHHTQSFHESTHAQYQ